MPQRNDAVHPNEVFADGIGWIGFHGGVVRIEFFSFGTPGTADATPAGTAGKAPEKEPERVVRQRIVMPIDGFLRSLGAIHKLNKRFVALRIISGNFDDPIFVGFGACGLCVVVDCSFCHRKERIAGIRF